MFKKIRGMFSNDLSIDLGTANTLIYVRDEGIILNEHLCGGDQNSKRTENCDGRRLRCQADAGPDPGNMTAIRPLKDGVIADFQVTEKMLQHFINKVHENSFFRPVQGCWSACHASQLRWSDGQYGNQCQRRRQGCALDRGADGGRSSGRACRLSRPADPWW